MVYKHAISTIVPARNVSSPYEYTNVGFHNGNGNNGNKNGNIGKSGHTVHDA
jgi:hypothetical protein